MGYGAWLHGEAVGCGMVLAADLSVRLGLADANLLARLRQLCQRARLPVVAPAMPVARWIELMQVDKKAEAGEIRFVLIDGLGKAVMRPAPTDLVAQVIQAHSASR
jgi:3-dehydroquinate synthase